MAKILFILVGFILLHIPLSDQLILWMEIYIQFACVIFLIGFSTITLGFIGLVGAG